MAFSPQSKTGGFINFRQLPGGVKKFDFRVGFVL